MEKVYGSADFSELEFYEDELDILPRTKIIFAGSYHPRMNSLIRALIARHRLSRQELANSMMLYALVTDGQGTKVYGLGSEFDIPGFYRFLQGFSGPVKMVLAIGSKRYD